MSSRLTEGLGDDDLNFMKSLLEGEIDDPFALPPAPPRFHSEKPIRVAIPAGLRSPVRSGNVARKCSAVFIGGTALTPGCSIAGESPHFCSNLSCIECDLIVLRFPDARWKPATDYLFLRLNYPDRLARRLYRASGYCAFCCQCTFKEAAKLQHLSTFSSNWVCRGHRPN
jgi:hypothetical protein